MECRKGHKVQHGRRCYSAAAEMRYVLGYKSMRCRGNCTKVTYTLYKGCGTSRGFAGLCPCTARCPQATHLCLAGASLPCSPPLPLHPSAAAASLGDLLKGKFAESLLLRPMSPTEGAIDAISILHTMPCCSRQEGLWHIITITWTAQEMAVSAKALTCTQ